MANCSTYISCNKKDLIIKLRQGRTTPPNNGRKKLKYQLLSNRGSVIYFITFPYLLPGLFQRKFYTNILERTDATAYAPQSNLRQLFPEYFTESRMRSFRNISRNHRLGSGIYYGKKGGTFPLQHYNIHWRKVTKYS